ncbi:mycothiol synthase [Agrococcus baldri]|uniref:Mycothiol acetyltransferase n=1 Tax=Agrococcus baldri TaxID=153730 RepID=A0AA87UT55_9MICO|nr:mycothiol synthase [Agrococcus baldri]GEK81314.1 mycothiol acetyltransferase [Agrococcus baldri]
MSDTGIDTAEAVRLATELGAACTAADGTPPFNDQALVELRRGERRAIGDAEALAIIADGSDGALPEVELAVHPDRRGRGLGAGLARRIADELGAFEAWAHGDLPAATAIAERLGMARVRTLLQLRAPVPAAATAADPLPEGARAFEPADASALLALNAAAFAEHPEQGRMSADDLAARRGEPWHDDANLIVLPGDEGLDAFTWVKPDGEVAELYVLGVSPDRQGAGLGRRMLDATFVRMRALGAETAHLYVEGDNAPALGLYRRAGFAQWAIDVRWRHAPFTDD